MLFRSLIRANAQILVARSIDANATVAEIDVGFISFVAYDLQDIRPGNRIKDRIQFVETIFTTGKDVQAQVDLAIRKADHGAMRNAGEEERVWCTGCAILPLLFCYHAHRTEFFDPFVDQGRAILGE